MVKNILFGPMILVDQENGIAPTKKYIWSCSGKLKLIVFNNNIEQDNLDMQLALDIYVWKESNFRIIFFWNIILKFLISDFRRRLIYDMIRTSILSTNFHKSRSFNLLKEIQIVIICITVLIFLAQSNAITL